MSKIKFTLTLLFGFFAFMALGQEETEKKEDKPVRQMFGSAYLIDNQSVVVYKPKTLEWVIQHRFGSMDNGMSDFFGLYGVANIRLGFNYVLFKNLSIGYGITQNKMHQDFNAKYAILQQTRSGSMPVSITYYGNFAIDAREKEDITYFANSTDRISYFNQLIIARRFSSKFSFQVAPSFTHYNAVPAFDDNGEIKGLRNNDHLAIAIGGRYKISSQGSIIMDINQPLTDHFADDPKANYSFGYEIVTSSHAFQLFVGNYWGLVPQENNFNSLSSDLLIGFNITRLWSF